MNIKNSKITKILIFLCILALIATGFVLSLSKEKPLDLASIDVNKAVFFVPHQDDETLFFSQAIAASVETYGKDNIEIILVSDGAASRARKQEPIKPILDEILSKTEDITGQSFDEDTLDQASGEIFSRMRTNEFLAALSSFGIDKYTYWDFPDASLPNNINNINELMEEYILPDLGRAVLFTYSPYYDPHEDHKAVGQALMEVYENHQNELKDKVFFIIKNEDDVEKDFKESKYYKQNALLIKNKKYNSSIEAAVEEYNFSAPVDTDAIAQELADYMTNNDSDLLEAIENSKTISEIRMAIGPNYSVQGMFENLNRNLKENTLRTILHKPFVLEE